MKASTRTPAHKQHAVLLPLLLVCGLVAATLTASASPTIVQLTNDEDYNYSYRTDGGQAAWATMGPGGVTVSLYDGDSTAILATMDWGAEGLDMHDGNVVWDAYEGGTSEIYMYDGSQVKKLTGDGNYHMNPSTHGGMVAWECYDASGLQIYLYDGTRVQRISAGAYENMAPRVYSGKVVWEGFDGNDMEIYMYDGSGVVQLSDNLFDDYAPEISDGGVVWMRSGPAGIDVMLYDGMTAAPLAEGYIYADNVRIDGNQAVWMAYDGLDTEIYMFDGENVIQVTSNEIDDDRPDISEGLVTWHRYEGVSYNIMYYDGTRVDYVTNDEHNHFDPVAGSGRIVWWSDIDADGEIFMAEGLAAQAELTSLTPQQQTVVLGATTVFRIGTDPAGQYDGVSVTVNGATVLEPFDPATGTLTVSFDQASRDTNDFKRVTATLADQTLVSKTRVMPVDYLTVLPGRAALVAGMDQTFTARAWSSGPDGLVGTSDDLGPFVAAADWTLDEKLAGTFSSETGVTTVLQTEPLDEPRRTVGAVFATYDTGETILEAKAVVAVVEPEARANVVGHGNASFADAPLDLAIGNTVKLKARGRLWPWWKFEWDFSENVELEIQNETSSASTVTVLGVAEGQATVRVTANAQIGDATVWSRTFTQVINVEPQKGKGSKK